MRKRGGAAPSVETVRPRNEWSFEERRNEIKDLLKERKSKQAFILMFGLIKDYPTHPMIALSASSALIASTTLAPIGAVLAGAAVGVATLATLKPEAIKGLLPSSCFRPKLSETIKVVQEETIDR
jgi:hypothetical protein